MHRSKCKLCNSIIEITNQVDIFSCACGEVATDLCFGTFHVHVKSDIDNFTLVDDDGNEIKPKYEKSKDFMPRVYDSYGVHTIDVSGDIGEPNMGSRRELLSMLDQMIYTYDNMPPGALHSPITHADLSAVLSLLSSIFKAS